MKAQTHKSHIRQGLPTTYEGLVRMYPLRALHDEADHHNAQEVIDALTSTHRPTRGQREYLEALSVLFEAYEREHHAIDTSDISGLGSLKYLMEQTGMSAYRLGKLLGDKALGSRILTGERQLSKAHIRKLADHFGVDPALFL